MLSTINAGDTAWMLLSAALVFLMTPGLAFFYGGLLSRKNTLSILLQCLTVICLVSLQWVLFGYSLSFGPDHNGWIGTLSWAGLSGVGAEPNLEYCSTIPHQAFMIYHAMVAVLASTIMLCAFAERMKFSAFCLFTLLWSTLVYDPVAHWVWSVGGFLRSCGALDFAGGTVVQANAAIAALAITLVLGKRKRDPTPLRSPDLPWAVLGAAMLWFGWFGLNTGSALGAGGLTAGAFVATQIAAATAGLTWLLLDCFFHRRPTLFGLITGVVGGLAAVTPAAGYVNVGGAIGIGMGFPCFFYLFAALGKKKFGDDDSLYIFGIHGIGGIWGVIATGLWATKSANINAVDGLFYGNAPQFLIQTKAVLAVMIYSFIMSWILLKFIDALIGLQAADPSKPAEEFARQ